MHINNIKARWINAKTACLAHEATLASNERFRRWNNRVTLVLAVLTAVSAVLVPVVRKTSPVAFCLTIAMAILTSGSKVVEQTFARPEDISTHLTAVARLRGYLDELNVLAGSIHNHVLGQRDLDLQKTHASVQALGVAIEDTRRNHPVPENADQMERATADFHRTTIKDALNQTGRLLQEVMRIHLLHFEVGTVLERSVRAVR